MTVQVGRRSRGSTPKSTVVYVGIVTGYGRTEGWMWMDGMVGTDG